ncbi:MAG TPA: hypothetical protein VF384_06160 [Planctomycetota bacterium]
MRILGVLLVLLGLGSSIVEFMHVDTVVLTWIDTWGEGAGWGIRAGCFLVGALLIKVGKPKKK